MGSNGEQHSAPSFATLQRYLPLVVLKHYELRSLEKSPAASKNKRTRRKKTEGVVEGENLKNSGISIPDVQHMECVSMFIDVASFTVLTGKLAKYSDGAGQLATALNNLMDSIVKLIQSKNGDIIKFAGDAILVIWPVTPGESNTKKSLSRQMDAALGAASDLMTKLEFNTFAIVDPNAVKSTINSPKSKPETLRIKIGISCGKTKILHLGGIPDNIVKNRFEYLAVGPALQEAFEAEGKCKPTQIVIPEKVNKMEIVQQKYMTEPVLDENEKQPRTLRNLNYRSPSRQIRLVSEGVLSMITPKFPIRKGSTYGTRRQIESVDDNETRMSGSGLLTEDPIATHFIVTKQIKDVNIKRERFAVNQSLESIGKLLWNYVPVAIVPYFSERPLEMWLPELRTVTTLFCSVNIEHLGLNRMAKGTADAEEEVLRITNKVQDAFRLIQQTVYRYHGTINKFLLDDKGCSLLIVFGLPPFAHENDPDRATLCAYGILGGLGKMRVGSHLGITTGRVYCGAIGKSVSRVEYTVIGDPVNVAARLMGEAPKQESSILIDEVTKLSLREPISYTPVHIEYLKGKGAYDAYRLTIGDENSEHRSELGEESTMELKRLSTAVFRTQLQIGLTEQHIINTSKGTNVRAKVAKTKAGARFVKILFDRRLMAKTDGFACNVIEVEYDDSNILSIDVEDNMRDGWTVGDLKNEVMSQLMRLEWPEFKKLDELLENKSTGPQAEPLGLSDIDNQRRMCERYSLLWSPFNVNANITVTEGDTFKELNDLFALQRFRVPMPTLRLKLKRTPQHHWRLKCRPKVDEPPPLPERKHGREKGIRFEENAFSIIDRLEILSNEFYSTNKPVFAKGKYERNMKTVLLEASNGAGKTYAVNHLISTILRTSTFEVLFAGGDPYEDTTNAEPFYVFSNIFEQLLDLRESTVNVNSKALFEAAEKIDLTGKVAASVIGSDQENRHKLILLALDRAKLIFDKCDLPFEAKTDSEKKYHNFDVSQLNLLNDILKSSFREQRPKSLKKAVEHQHMKKVAPNITRNKAQAARTMSTMLLSKVRFTLGEQFEENEATRLSLSRIKRQTINKNAVHSSQVAKSRAFAKCALPRKSRNGSKRSTDQLHDFKLSPNLPEDVRTKKAPSLLDESDDNIQPETRERLGSASRSFINEFREVEDEVDEENEFLLLEELVNSEEFTATANDDPIEISDDTSMEDFDDIKDMIKLLAAILVGLSSKDAPLFINIDNTQLVDPYSLMVIQELTQWWSAGHVMLLLALREMFSADVGLSNIRNYVSEAEKRMSVVAISDRLYNTMNAAVDEQAASNASSVSLLLSQLNGLTRTTNIHLYSDPQYTSEVIECSLVLLNKRIQPSSLETLNIDEHLLRYLEERAFGNFQYVRDILQLYFTHNLIYLEENRLKLTQTGGNLMAEALNIPKVRNAPPIRKMSKIDILKRKIGKPRLEGRSRSRSRSGSSNFQSGDLVQPVINLGSLVPMSMAASFGEYFDSLMLKDQLILKSAALIASRNKKSNKGQFKFDTIREICPFYHSKQKNKHAQDELSTRFDLLKQTKLIVPVQKNSGGANKSNEHFMYKFRSEWLVEIIVSRLLAYQCKKLESRIEMMIEKATRSRMPQNSFGTQPNTDDFKGYLHVKKTDKNGYKKRFGILADGKFVLYKEDPTKVKPKNQEDNKRTVIYLDSDAADCYDYVGPVSQSFFKRNAYANLSAFIVKTNHFIVSKEGGLPERSLKQFLFIAKDYNNKNAWMSRIKKQIAQASDPSMIRISIL